MDHSGQLRDQAKRGTASTQAGRRSTNSLATSTGGQSYEDALTVWLDERDVLVVLDNCEHVVSAVADLVEDLTARLPRLHVLATSREPLWVADELSYRLAPLPVAGRDATREEIDASPAVRLFRERAGARTQT